MPWWVSSELQDLIRRLDDGEWHASKEMLSEFQNKLAFHLEKNWWELAELYGRTFELEKKR